MYRTFILFLLSLALLSLSAPLGASIIYVSGDQTGTWAADTVIVTAEVRVPSGQSLTILPGVEVLFSSIDCQLLVDNGATLQAIGALTDSIRFDVLAPNEHWRGIRFLSASDSCRLEYCHLTHGDSDINYLYGGVIYCSSTNLAISNNTINANNAPGGGGGIYCTGSSCAIVGNLIADNTTAWGSGGGILCQNNPSTIIRDNEISGNDVPEWDAGGGICCYNSNALISGNIIRNNSTGGHGGGIFCDGSGTIIRGNIIRDNSVNGDDLQQKGGGIYCSGSGVTIEGNTIFGNVLSSSTSTADCLGGGIYFACFNSTIHDNAITANTISSTYGSGGGIFCQASSSTITGNIINGNSVPSNGGGIYCYYSSPNISGNTISGNSAASGGGIFFSESPNSTIVNCILWGNSPQQIWGQSGPPQVNYSDIQGGYTGTGNINVWPAFVDTAQHDYRLQWGSPCIDSGDPNPIYNDPDGSRADMGAWYYDQSLPVRILLTPYNAPIQIPASGGSFQYAIQATNIESTTLSATVWCNATLPSGAGTAPLLGPVTISLTSGQTLSRLRTQTVPAGAPAGIYHYNAYAVAVGDTSQDSFTFTKLGFGIRDSGFGGWENTGEALDTPLPSQATRPRAVD